MKIKNNYILLLLSSLFFSCQDEQEFKLPVEVSFYVDIQRNPVAGSRLQFEDGYLIISSFGFEGEREQAKDVEFSREYEQGLTIPFTSDKPVEALVSQFPQGNYTNISIAFETFDGFGESNLFVRGTYRNTEGKRYPLVFALRSSEIFEIRAKSYSDGNQVILKKEAPTAAHIRLSPIYWFQAVPLSALEEAEVVLWNGEPTIVISEETNEELYDLIEERLEQGSEVVFIY